MPSLRDLRRERVQCIAALYEIHKQQRRIDIFVEDALDRVAVIFQGEENFERAHAGLIQLDKGLDDFTQEPLTKHTEEADMCDGLWLACIKKGFEADPAAIVVTTPVGFRPRYHDPDYCVTCPTATHRSRKSQKRLEEKLAEAMHAYKGCWGYEPLPIPRAFLEKATDFDNPFQKLDTYLQKRLLSDSVFEKRGSIILAPHRRVESTHCITGIARIMGKFSVLYELMRDSAGLLANHTIPLWRARLESRDLLKYRIVRYRHRSEDDLEDDLEGDLFVPWFKTIGDSIEDLEKLIKKYIEGLLWCWDRNQSPPKITWTTLVALTNACEVADEYSDEQLDAYVDEQRLLDALDSDDEHFVLMGFEDDRRAPSIIDGFYNSYATVYDEVEYHIPDLVGALSSFVLRRAQQPPSKHRCAIPLLF